jgi:hypothetical protein
MDTGIRKATPANARRRAAASSTRRAVKNKKNRCEHDRGRR